MDVHQILYVNHMKNQLSGSGQESVHIMFDDGSLLQVQIELDPTAQPAEQGASFLLQKLLNLVEQMPKSTSEIAPMCLGDTTCMYCNGKGCVNCRRDQ